MSKNQHGLARGLTNYGDMDFSLYLRRANAASMGYGKEILGKTVVGMVILAAALTIVTDICPS